MAAEPFAGRLNAALPPIAERSQATARLVESGFVPGVTTALKPVALPACTGFGLADPVAVGGLDVLETVRLMLKVPDRV